MRYRLPLLLGLLCGLACLPLRAEPAAWPGEELRKELGAPAEPPGPWEALSFPSQPGEGERRVEAVGAMHLGGQRMLLRVVFNQPPDFSADELMLNFDLDGSRDTGETTNNRPGTDLYLTLRDQQWRERLYPPVCASGETEVRALAEGAVLYVMVDCPELARAPQQRFYLRYRTPGQADQYVACAPFRLPGVEATPPELEPRRFTLIAPGAMFRFISASAGPLHPGLPMAGRKKGLVLEKLSNKGLKGADIKPEESNPFGRPAPLPLFRAEAAAPKGAVQEGEVPFTVREEAGVTRPRALVAFGLPLPQGALWDPAALRVRSGEAEPPLSAQATVLWGDGSIRWALIEFEDTFAAGEQRAYTATWGPQVAKAGPTLAVHEEEGRFVVDTGVLKASISKVHGGLLDAVEVAGRSGSVALPEGVALEDEHGTRFTTRQARLTRATVEERTPRKVTFRLEGAYTSAEGKGWMQFVTRLTFRAGEARVGFAHTHLNNHLEREFSDFRFLSLPLELPEPAGKVRMLAAGAREVEAVGKLAFHQQTEAASTFRTPEGGQEGGRAPGVFAVEAGGWKISGGLVDSWQRWPKGISVEARQVRLDLLPPYEKAFEETLPPHLRFPFCEGFYRLKWGMSFTERFVLDFAGETTQQQLAAEGQLPLVAVLPAEWYAQTRAFGDVALGSSAIHQQWDAFFEKSFRAHLERRERQREYGFLNYGDWFGERARNWGNNEYDTAHAFFNQFCRAGNADYFRAGLAAARHQADVDLVHAYPDPASVGAQVIHGVGHTGSSSHLVEYGMWSNALHLSARITNGHTWAEGLVEAWYLVGDAPVMEAALKMGENAAYVAAPRFRMSAASPRFGGWALRAIMPLYHATRDPLYLEAATRIARESTKDQDPGGGWFWGVPTVPGLYHKQAREDQKAPGMTVFQSGILLGGWKEYHRVTRDPQVEPAMKAAAALLMRSWKLNGGWPYIVSPDGSGHPYKPDVMAATNGYVADGFVYVGNELLHDEAYREVALQAFETQLRTHEILAAGQRIGYTLRGGNHILSQCGLSPAPTQP